MLRRLPHPCPTCRTQEFVPRLNVRGTPIYTCPTCGLATWDWSGFDFAAFYDETYWRSTEIGKGYADYFALAAAMERTHGQRLRWVVRRLGGGEGSGGRHQVCAHKAPSATVDPTKPAAAPTLAGAARSDCSARSPRLLDAGCGPGFFVRAASEAGFDAAGVEISEYAVRFAREELGVNVRRGEVRAADLHGGPYDVVTLWDVLEHLPDPAAGLAAAFGALRPGGLLALSTCDIATLTARLSGARWHLFNLPEHLWFFTARSLERLLTTCGFAVVEKRYEVCWYTTRYVVERLEAVLRAPRVLSRRLGPLGRMSVPLTLGDIVTVLARKPVGGV